MKKESKTITKKPSAQAPASPTEEVEPSVVAGDVESTQAKSEVITPSSREKKPSGKLDKLSLNKLVGVLKNYLLFTALSIVITVVVSVVIFNYFIIPNLKAISQLRAQNEQERAKAEVIAQNITSLRNIPDEEVEDSSQVLESFMPSSKDILRMASIMEEVAKISKIKISSIQTVIKTIKSPSSTGTSNLPSEPSTGIPSGGSSPQSSVRGVPQVAAATTEKEYSINVSLKGDFLSAIKFLSNLKKVNRAILVSEITTKGSDTTAEIKVLLGEPQSSARPDQVSSFTQEEKEVLNQISQLSIDAFPSAAPTGRPNPFK